MTEDKSFVEAEVRTELIKMLQVDLVGPQKEDEVLDDNPMFDYLTGMLYPKCLFDSAAVNEQEIDIDVDRSDNDSDYTSSFSEENENDPINETKFTKQYSIGMSFYLGQDTEEFVVDVKWGDYTKSREEYVNEKGEEKTKTVYIRHPMKDSLLIKLSDFQKYKDYCLQQDSHLQMHVVKFKLDSGYQLVTVHLNNQRPNGDSELDFVAFQVEMSVRSVNDGERIFVAESVCREILNEEEYYYSGRPIFGRGRGCAVMWENSDVISASRIYTTFIPEYEMPGVEANIPEFDKYYFLMSFFAKPSNKAESIAKLNALCNAYKNWITTHLKNNSKMSDAEFKEKVGDKVISKCEESLRRIQEGIGIINSNSKAFDAFCFMNSVMTLQRSIANYSKKHGKGVECSFSDFINPKIDSNKFCWRPFQIAFILLNLKGIVDPMSKDREMVDLLYFPTGGGKTEAYLGLIAFVIAYRRLNIDISDGYNRDGGVTAILRYTLRLLTSQQRDRLTKMIIAADMERKRQLPKYGYEPITMGFWVGGGVTPNKFADLEDNPQEPDKARKNKNLLYKQLLKCPFCGKELSEENYHIDFEAKKVYIFCDDEKCIYYKYGNPKAGIKEPQSLPVMLIDEEIYRGCPTVILATVDKFATLPWRVETNSLFGRVDRKCSRDGYISIGEKHGLHKATEKLPASKINKIKPFAPPELIVQDELHLITGPLGTIYGAYETIIEKLASYKIGDKVILPKYVVSTATIKNAQEQIKCLYGRKEMMQFPSNGFEISNSFFIQEVPIDKKPFRKYVGINAVGASMKTTTLRVYAIILQAVHELFKIEKYKDFVDPYYTLIGYFNSIRELGGTVRLLQDDIPKRITRLKRKYKFSDERRYNEFSKVEITSRIGTAKIPEMLDRLEAPMNDRKCLDVAIATNMIAVGMDVDRLGLMTVLGQPKLNSEYIQASSRIGRQHPGVVFTIYNPYRPRDLSHYENFVGYHEQLYRYVEGTTATPFADRARDRALHALVVSAIRLLYPEFAENQMANNIASLSDKQKAEVIDIILKRLSIVNPQAIVETANEIEEFLGDWKSVAAQQKPLTYYVGNSLLTNYNRLMNYYSEPCSSTEKGTLNSMREVENVATLFYFEED